MEKRSIDLVEVKTDSKCVEIIAATCKENVTSQKSIDIGHSNMESIEYEDEDYYDDTEEENGEYFKAYRNYSCESVDYYQEYGDEYYEDDYYPYSYYGDGVDDITFSNIQSVILPLIRATMRKEKVVEDAHTFLLSVLGVCSIDQRQQLMKTKIGGNTPLSTCCEIGNLNLAKFLVENCNADVNGLPLIWSIFKSHMELFHYLYQNADLGVCLDNHYSLLMCAVGIRPNDISDLYQKNEERKDSLYLHSNLEKLFDRYSFYRIGHGFKMYEPSFDIVEILIKSGIVKKLSGLNLFECLAHCIETAMKLKFFHLIVDAIDEIDNIRNQQGCSILGFAIKKKKLHIVQKLLEKGADINNTKMLKCINDNEIDSETIRSIVNNRWLSLINLNKTHQELNIEFQGYVHPVVYCASINEHILSYGFGGGSGGMKENKLDMLSYLMKLPEIDIEDRLNAVEILGAYYTIRASTEWNKAYQIAFKCWNMVTDMRCGSQVIDSCCGDNVVITEIDEKKEQNNDIAIQSNSNATASSTEEINHIIGKNSLDVISIAKPCSTTGTNQSNNDASSLAEISRSYSYASNEGELDDMGNSNSNGGGLDDMADSNSDRGELDDLGNSNSDGGGLDDMGDPNSDGGGLDDMGDPNSDGGGLDDMGDSNSDGGGLDDMGDSNSDGGGWADFDDSNSIGSYDYFYQAPVVVDTKIDNVHEYFSLSNNQEKEISQKTINNQPRSVFMNKLELQTKEELESLKPENRIEIATQSALLFERLVGYDSQSTIQAFIQLGKLYERFGDKEQYLTIMIYILVHFREKSSCPNSYQTLLKNLASIVVGKNTSNTYQLDICTMIIITKLFYMSNIQEKSQYKRFSFLLAAIDKLRMYEKTDDELHDFNSLLRVVVKLDRRDEFGQSLLHYAVLLKKQENMGNSFGNHDNMYSDNWMLSAFNGGSLSLTNFLLQYGVNPNACDDEGMTPLHSVYKVLGEKSGSLSSESKEIVESLIEAGGHLDCVDACGKTPIGYSQKTTSPLCPVVSRSLQCIASSLIIRNNIDYEGHIPQTLVQFVQLHEKRGAKQDKTKFMHVSHGNKFKCMQVM